ncbi:MAG: tetratricopeptide repeat protein, partial [Deltaproteobacteria bacterium]|nr:tetratricopeptide repeat protein [Deltaproteobacteria bacterium]
EKAAAEARAKAERAAAERAAAEARAKAERAAAERAAAEARARTEREAAEARAKAEREAAAKAAAEKAAAVREVKIAAPPPAAGNAEMAEASKAIARGDVALGAKNFAGAEKHYREALQKHPTSVEANYKLGLVFGMTNRFESAVQQFEQVLRIDPHNAGARANLDRARKKAIELRAARPASNDLPPEIAAQQLYKDAVKLITQRQYREAIVKLDESLRLKHDFALAYVARGSSYVGIADYRRAIAEYQKALTFDASLAAPHYGLAEAYRGLGDTARAKEHYQKYMASSGRDKDPNLTKAAQAWIAKLGA